MLIIGCNNSIDKKSVDNKFFYTSFHKGRKYKTDTLSQNKIKRHGSEDLLIADQYFEFNGGMHLIQMFTNDLNAPIDGGVLFYELDSLGIIYSRSTTWYSYRRLKSSNDSINSIIEAAFENILLYSKLSCYQPELTFKETIKFTPPTIEENKP